MYILHHILDFYLYANRSNSLYKMCYYIYYLHILLTYLFKLHKAHTLFFFNSKYFCNFFFEIWSFQKSAMKSAQYFFSWQHLDSIYSECRWDRNRWGRKSWQNIISKWNRIHFDCRFIFSCMNFMIFFSILSDVYLNNLFIFCVCYLVYFIWNCWQFLDESIWYFWKNMVNLVDFNKVNKIITIYFA